MSNKDMPAYPVIRLELDEQQQDILLLALHTAHLHLYSCDDRKDMRDMVEEIKQAQKAALAESQQPAQESGESDPFPNCTMECGGLTNWCKCRSDAAALEELEGRELNKQTGETGL